MSWTEAFAVVMAETLGGSSSEWHAYLEDHRGDDQA